MSPSDPVIEELGKIDYLLEHLARAVDHGDAPYEVYARMSPRYLERRAELVEVVARRAGRSFEPSPPAATGEVLPPPQRASFEYPAPDMMSPAAYPPPAFEVAPVVPRPRPAPRSTISAGTWMTYAGAFLVVVAVAIFTIYAWMSMPVAAKLLVLVAVTSLFYAGGEFVRTRMELPSVGVALVGVGSAMLLFDGWAVINGFGMTGPGPWAVLLLGCSLIYWATELRIAGGWFGAVGAAAQVGWWWLLGQALHLPTHWQIAGIALVAMAWALAGDRVRREGPLAVLGAVLRSGSLLLAIVMSVAMLSQALLLAGSGTLALLLAALVTAVSVTVVIEVPLPEQRRRTALFHVPVLIALAVNPDPGTVALTSMVFAAGYGAYAVLRGGDSYAGIALAAGAFAVPAAGDRLKLASTTVAGVAGALFALAASVGHRLSGTWTPLARGTVARPSEQAGTVWRYAGLAALALVTFIGVPSAAGGVPLAAFTVTSAHALLACWMLALWALVVGVTRSRAAGWAAFAWSFYALAAVAAWALPHLHSAWYAAALLALAAAWEQAQPSSGRWLNLDTRLLTAVCRLLMVIVPVGGVLGASAFFRVDAYPVAALLLVAAAAWTADALRSRSWWALAPAAAFGVASAFVAGWHASGLSGGAAAAAGAGAALALAGALGPRRRDGWGAFLAIGATVPATLSLAGAVGHPGRLTAALVLVTAAWAFAAIAADAPLLLGVAGLFASFVLDAALVWRDPSPFVSFVAYPVLAAALLLPVGLRLGASGSSLRRAARPLAAAAVATAGQFAFIGLAQTLFGRADIGAHAFQVGEVGLGFGLMVTGAIVVLWSAVESFEVGGYFGYGVVTAGLFAFMDHAGVRTAEYYLLVVAAYALAMGFLYTRREVGRRMPAAADGVAFAAAVVGPFLLSLNLLDTSAALRHGLWTLALSIMAIVAGRLSRTRIHFLGGIAVAILEALWLSRSVLLALPTWIWIGLAGLGLIVGGVTFARREALEAASRRVSEGLEGWR